MTVHFSCKKLKSPRNLSKEIGISQSLLIRMAVDDLLKEKEKLKKKLFSRKGE